jgi:aminodeoxyfutalosine deaminase
VPGYSAIARIVSADIEAFVRAMPKVELHVHLVGAIAIGDGADRFASFADFAAAYGRRHRRVRTGVDLATAVAQLAERLAACRVAYAEVTVTPLPHLESGLEPDELADALDGARRRAAAEHAVRIAWVFDVSGDGGEQAGLATVAWVRRYAPEGTVGFGLGGPEIGVPRSLFRAAFDQARAAGLRSVPHAGESAGPESVWSALRDLRAERIGHGIQSVRDPALLDHLASGSVALEVCPTSNLRTGVVPALPDHPLPVLIESGVPVTLATDNPAIFGTDLNDEYVLAHEGLGLSRTALVEVAATGIEAAFCEPELKARLRSELRRFAAAHSVTISF